MADRTVTERAAAMHHRLERQLDELMGSGMLLDPAALRRLRSLLDEALPVADAYAEQIGDLHESAVA